MVTNKYGINLLFLTPGQVGGTQTYSQNIITELEKQLFPNEVLVIYCCKNSQSMFEASDKVQIRVLPINSKNVILRYITEQLLLPIIVLIDKINVLLSLGYTQPILLSCKSVVTIHDLNWYYHPEDFTKLYGFLWKILSTLGMKYSNHIISVSESTKKSIQEIIGIDSSKISTIYHGINQPKIFKKTEINKFLRSIGIHTPYILSIISHYPHKNIKTLLSAYKMLRQEGIKISLVIGGTGTEINKRERKIIVDDYKLNDVILLPYLESSQLDMVYQGSSVFVFPSLYEGFGFPVLEAMSNQIPVICSDSSSLPEIVQNSAITFNPEDSNELFKIIKYLLKDKSKREFLIDRGISQSKKFTWQKAALETLSLIRRIENE